MSKTKSTFKEIFPISPFFAFPSHLTTPKGEATSFLAEYEELVQVQYIPLQSELGSISNPVQI